MSRLHFLNVKQGDCSIIEHVSGNVTVVDVCNARKEDSLAAILARLTSSAPETSGMGSGNFNQKAYPVNPLEYMRFHGIDSVFRFVLSHPDMDHLDGIKDLFEVFPPVNFWDTANRKVLTGFGLGYREEDWRFYTSLRDSSAAAGPRRLTLYSGDDGAFRTRDWSGSPGGDRLYVLAPTPELVSAANVNGDYNDCSYVLLHWAPGGKVIFGGDAHDRTWEHIIDTYGTLVEDVDLLIAPHHGRSSGRDYRFLDVLRPKMTFFGNARSEHLAYPAWNSRELPFVTNNQANCMVVDLADPTLPLYVTNEAFARARNPFTFYSAQHRGWYLQAINLGALAWVS